MGINDRVEQLHRVLEAMNAWHAASDRDASGNGHPEAGAAEPQDERLEQVPPEPRSEVGPELVGRRHAVAPPEPPTDAPPPVDVTPAQPPPEVPRPATELVDDLLLARTADVPTLQAATEIAESLGLGYHLGSAVQRIAVASGRGRAGVEPLREAMWLIDRYVALVEQRPVGADLHASAARLARTGDAIARLRALSDVFEAESAAIAGTRATEPVSALDATAPVTGPREPAAEVASGEPREETAPEPSASARDDRDDDEDTPSFGREIAFVAARWTIMAAAVVVVVLAVTLIGQWA